MGSLNKVMLIGRLGKDPEVRYTANGSAVANFSVATSEYWTDKQGQKQEKTEWHNIVCWNKLADLAQNYLKKGKLVYLEGRLQTTSWDDQSGQKRYKTEINADIIQFLERADHGGNEGGNYAQDDGRQQGNPSGGQQGGGFQGGGSRGSGPSSGGQYQKPESNKGGYSPNSGGNRGPAKPPADNNDSYIEDDIPF